MWEENSFESVTDWCLASELVFSYIMERTRYFRPIWLVGIRKFYFIEQDSTDRHVPSLKILYGGEHVKYCTLWDQGNVSDCTGCQNTQDLVYVNRNLHKFNVKGRNCVCLIM